MMDDVLISNLPPAFLRSSLRVLVSQGSSTQKPFVQHIRSRLLESPPSFTPANTLFPSWNGTSGDTQPSADCLQYLALTRCFFSAKLVQQSLLYLNHFVQSIVEAGVLWGADDELERTFNRVSGDIVQAVQALKESAPVPSDELEVSLRTLLSSLNGCARYCSEIQAPYPFQRAERQVYDAMAIIFPTNSKYPSAIVTAKRPIEVDISRSSSKLEKFAVGPHQMPRLFNGLWQLSSPAWGSGSLDSQEKALVNLVEAGLTATDMADHYGDAELIYGDFRARLPDGVREQVHAATKWCIFGPINRTVTTEWVLEAVKERCRRLGGRVELLQFHWYDYGVKGYLDILVELVRISKEHPELVSAIGLCNFDSSHTKEVCEYLLQKTGSVGVVSNQVQFSLLDTRPLQGMVSVCEKYQLKLLTYGSFCGGFISSKWLRQPVPEVYGETARLTPSQRKYFDMIGNWGTWSDFQTLLTELSRIANKHSASLTNIATRWVLQQSAVGAVIVGTRLGVSAHAEDNLKVFDFQLDEDDLVAINNIALGANGEKSRAVFDKLGDCGNEYRSMH